jgi:hypothetical protein
MTTYHTSDFESNNLSEWNVTPWHDGSSPAASVVSSPVIYGTYCGRVLNSSTVNSYSGISNDLGSTKTTLYFRAYIEVTALPQSGYSITTIQTQDSTGNNNPTALEIYNNAGSYNWRLKYGTNASWTNSSDASPSTITINTPYCVEIYFIAGSGSGEVGVYVNGTRVIQVTSLSNDNSAKLPQLLVAVAYAGNEASLAYSLYFDKTAAANAYIGPFVSQHTLTVNSTPITGIPFTIEKIA